MARVSLLLVAMPLVATGCVDPPPEYSVPSLVPPVVVTSRVDPPTTSVTAIPATTTTLNFNIPFRADDAGEDLYAWFLLDLDPTSDISPSFIEDQKSIPSDPLPFEDQIGPDDNRSVAWSWSLDKSRPAPGCHALTMILSHQNNFLHFYEMKDDLAAAQVTWLLDVLDETGGSHSCGPSAPAGASP